MSTTYELPTIEQAPNSNPATSYSGPNNMPKSLPKWTIPTAILAIILIIFIVVSSTIHKVDEGNVAVYYRGGALLDTINYPGYHFMLPLITTYRQVQITLQTDEVRDVPCGTKGGVIIYFDRIEVVNILSPEKVHDVVKKYTYDYDRPLIFNKVHHEINQFCSKHSIQEVYIDLFDQIDENLKSTLMKDLLLQAPGLTVQEVRVTKPRIPQSIMKNYEQMEAEKTELLVASQHQKVVEKLAETEKNKAIIEAEQAAQVAGIKHKQTIAQKEMEKTVNKLDDEIHIAKQKANADAELYKVEKEAEANAKLLTKEFLELQRIEAIKNNNKVYYGDSIPNAFFQENDLKGKAGVALRR